MIRYALALSLLASNAMAQPVTATATIQPTTAQALAPTAMTLQMQGIRLSKLGWTGDGGGNQYYIGPEDSFQQAVDGFNRGVVKAQKWLREVRPFESADYRAPTVNVITAAGDDSERLRSALASLPFILQLSISTDPTTQLGRIPTDEERESLNPSISLVCPWATCGVVNITE